MTLVVRYLFISLLLLTGCVSNENQYQGYIFGTYYNIKISDSPNLNTIQSSIDFKLREIDMLFSNYKSESYLMRFNRKEKQATNDDFTNLLNHSIEICKFVNQNFNIFAGSLVNLWGFGPVKRMSVPKDDDIENIIPKGCASRDNDHLEIDFSAIA